MPGVCPLPPEPVAILAAGVVTPIGGDLDQFWTGLLTGADGISAIERFSVSDLKVGRGSMRASSRPASSQLPRCAVSTTMPRPSPPASVRCSPPRMSRSRCAGRSRRRFATTRSAKQTAKFRKTSRASFVRAGTSRSGLTRARFASTRDRSSNNALAATPPSIAASLNRAPRGSAEATMAAARYAAT